MEVQSIEQRIATTLAKMEEVLEPANFLLARGAVQALLAENTSLQAQLNNALRTIGVMQTKRVSAALRVLADACEADPEHTFALSGTVGSVLRKASREGALNIKDQSSLVKTSIEVLSALLGTDLLAIHGNPAAVDGPAEG